MARSATAAALGDVGFAFVPALASMEECREVAAGLPVANDRAGIRGLLRLPAVADLARRAALDPRVASCMDGSMTAIDVLLFDKTPSMNWKVGWHQDLAIRIGVRQWRSGYSSWNYKTDAWYAQPPASVLQSLIALRIHLDPCGQENGPLRVIPASHHLGKVAATTTLPDIASAATCTSATGDAWLMKPLVLHASSQAVDGHRRRVLHVVYAPSGFLETH